MLPQQMNSQLCIRKVWLQPWILLHQTNVQVTEYDLVTSEYWNTLPDMLPNAEKKGLRKLSHPSNPDEVCGWVSFEDINMRTDQSPDIVAFPVAKGRALRAAGF
jgi:hypothetical protein